MFQRITDIFTRQSSIPKGYGVTELPMRVFQGKQPLKASEFKTILNDVFLSKIKELGFRGKDFHFVRQNEIYTEVVFFWTYKTGGAIQADLLVKFNNIKYPDDTTPTSPNNIRPENAEFQKRLSPNGEKDKNGQEIWFWVFADNLKDNIKIAEDIWRVFSIRGIEFFDHFKKHRQYIGQVSAENYLEFPDFFLQRFFGRHEAGIIYFLFDYWRQMQDKLRANEFAKLGVAKLCDTYPVYAKIFDEYLKEQS
jgi:hypothetical protein